MSGGVPLSLSALSSNSTGAAGLNPPNMYQPPAVFQQVQNEMASQTVTYPQRQIVGVPQIPAPVNIQLATPQPQIQPTVYSSGYPQSNQFIQNSPVQLTYPAQPVQVIQPAPMEPSKAGLVNEPILLQYKSGWLVTGNTIQYKDHLKNLGGKFGKNYKGANGEDLTGWWFPTDKYQAVCQLLGQIKQQMVQPAPVPNYQTRARESPSKNSNMQKITVMVKRPKPGDLLFMIGTGGEKQLTLVDAIENGDVVSQLTLREEGNQGHLYAVPVNINGTGTWIVLSPQNTWAVLDIRPQPVTLPVFGSIGSTNQVNPGKIPSSTSLDLSDPSKVDYPQVGQPQLEGVAGPGVLQTITSFS